MKAKVAIVLAILLVITVAVLIWLLASDNSPLQPMNVEEEEAAAVESSPSATAGPALPASIKILSAEEAAESGASDSNLAFSLPNGQSTWQIISLNIALQPSGVVKMGDDSFPADGSKYAALTQALTKIRTEASKDEELVVMVEADDRAKGQAFVDLLEAIDTAGVENVTLVGFQPN